MTTRPRTIDFDRSRLPGLIAVGLFVVLASVVLASDFGVLAQDVGFPEGESIVAAIGMTLLGLEAGIPVENFLVPLLIVAIALDAALDGSLMLAKRDEVPSAGATAPTEETPRTAGAGGSSGGGPDAAGDAGSAASGGDA